MARCKLCERWGLPFTVNSDGLCGSCRPGFYMELEQRHRVLDESIELIQKSKNLDTVLSRLDVGIEHLQALQQYEARGIPTVKPSPSAAIEQWRQQKADSTIEHLSNDLIVAREKAANAKTLSGKINPFGKVLEKNTKYQIQLDDITKLEQLEQTIKHDIAAISYSHHIEEAKRAEFKSQNKKALDQYLEALYVLRTDPIPDKQQRDEIALCEEKIAALGGTVPQDQ